MIEINLFYIKYNLLPNLIAYGLAYSFHSKKKINCSFKEYYNYILSFFNIQYVDLIDEYRIINNILINKYALLLINTDDIELVRLKNRI